MSATPDWAAMKRRLAAMRSAIERGGSPSAAETRKTLARRARDLAREERRSEATAAPIEFLEFWIGASRFGLSVAGLREAVTEFGLLPLPKAPAFVAGLINLRGQIVSVLDLRALLDLGGKADDLGRVIVLGEDDRLLGLRVDRVGAVRRVESNSVQGSVAALPGGGGTYMIGVAEDRTLLLDGRKILADQSIVLRAEKAGERS